MTLPRTIPKSDDAARPWRHVRFALVAKLTSEGPWEWTELRVKGKKKLGLLIPVGRWPQRVSVWEFKLSGGSWIRKTKTT